MLTGPGVVEGRGYIDGRKERLKEEEGKKAVEGEEWGGGGGAKSNIGTTSEPGSGEKHTDTRAAWWRRNH